MRLHGASRLGGVVVSVLATGPKSVSGSNPAKAMDFFKGDKNLQQTFLSDGN
jgi:hypothetical protein